MPSGAEGCEEIIHSEEIRADGGCYLTQNNLEHVSEKVTLQQRCGWAEESSKNIPGGRHSQCKGPGARGFRGPEAGVFDE